MHYASVGKSFPATFLVLTQVFLGDGFDPLNHLTIYKPPPPYPGEHHSHFSSSTPDLASQTLPPLVGGSSPDLVSRRTLGPAAGRHNQVMLLMRLISCISGRHVLISTGKGSFNTHLELFLLKGFVVVILRHPSFERGTCSIHNSTLKCDSRISATGNQCRSYHLT